MNKTETATHLTVLDLAVLQRVAGGAPLLAPSEGIGPRLREETDPEGNPVIVRIYY